MSTALAVIRAALVTAVTDADGARDSADQLCRACVDTLQIDGASLSLTYGETAWGTFGASSPTSRRIDELQFTYGEGPCLEAVATGRPVLAVDLDDPTDPRWPAFKESVLQAGIAAVFALPVVIASSWVGALDLYRHATGPMSELHLSGGLFAAELAALTVLDLLGEVDWDDAAQGGDRWEQLASLERVEVYQATGMLVGAMAIRPPEALSRLRAYAFSRGLTASEVAYGMVEGRVPLDGGEWGSDEGG